MAPTTTGTTTHPTQEVTMTITTTHGTGCTGCTEAAKTAEAQHKAMPAIAGCTLEFAGIEHTARIVEA